MWKNTFSFEGRIRRIEYGVPYSSTLSSLANPQQLNFNGEIVNLNYDLIPYLGSGIEVYDWSSKMEYNTADNTPYKFISSNPTGMIMREIYSCNNYFYYHLFTSTSKCNIINLIILSNEKLQTTFRNRTRDYFFTSIFGTHSQRNC